MQEQQNFSHKAWHISMKILSNGRSCFSVKKKAIFCFWCFGIMIFRLGGKNCIVKNEKLIVLPEPWYVDPNLETFPKFLKNFGHQDKFWKKWVSSYVRVSSNWLLWNLFRIFQGFSSKFWAFFRVQIFCLGIMMKLVIVTIIIFQYLMIKKLEKFYLLFLIHFLSKLNFTER